MFFSRRELEIVTADLHQAKESYVVLSEESRWIEKQTRERCEEEANQRMKDVRPNYNFIAIVELPPFVSIDPSSQADSAGQNRGTEKF